MKKIIALLLVLTGLISFNVFPVSAEADIAAMIELNSNISGYTYQDYEKFVEIKSDKIDFYIPKNSDVALVADYRGSMYLGDLKPGRTYYIYYYFAPNEGYEIPDELNDSNFKIDCGSGCSVVSLRKVAMYYSFEKTIPLIALDTKVVVDGNIFQKIIGRIQDIILKIKSWSPY
ncbi:MAG: hypothetical protein KBT46_09850 [Ruminococcus sp.]|nr:hypothetical protein [Candidatus Copronaster equi]